jgi:hypothetical protein
LLDQFGSGGRDVGAVGTQPRQWLRRQIMGKDALAALLHEIAADRLAHHAKADEADSPVLSHFPSLVF